MKFSFLWPQVFLLNWLIIACRLHREESISPWVGNAIHTDNTHCRLVLLTIVFIVGYNLMLECIEVILNVALKVEVCCESLDNVLNSRCISTSKCALSWEAKISEDRRRVHCEEFGRLKSVHYSVRSTVLSLALFGLRSNKVFFLIFRRGFFIH